MRCYFLAHVVLEKHAGDAGGRQGADDAAQKGGNRDLDDVARAPGRDLRQHTDLDAEGANIAEALRHVLVLDDKDHSESQWYSGNNSRSRRRW
jgi:hypothetical protein